MNVLIIKTSSLGDILHTLPALTDASKAIPNIRFDWVVEENFSEIPSWHPFVDQVIPVALRRWRKKPIRSLFGKEWKQFRQKIRAKHYDMVIDAQGLLKSAFLACLCRGYRIGLDKQSLTEPLARFAYQRTVNVDLKRHAVFRMRSIFAQALDYTLPTNSIADYGLSKHPFVNNTQKNERYLLFVHGTTWPSKHWTEKHWIRLAVLAVQGGYKIRLPWCNEKERERAERIAVFCKAAQIIPRMNLSGIAHEIANAYAVVSVDSGLGHLAAALKTPSISLYGPTNPNRIGTIGKNQHHILSDFECIFCDKSICSYAKRKHSTSASLCLEHLSPEKVWEILSNTCLNL